MIELHTVPTANGYKASIMLEETGLPYTVKSYDLIRGEHLSSEYLARNPVGRMPMIVDDDAGTPQSLTVYGTAAILVYLAEKTGRLLPERQPERSRVFEWLGIVSSDIAPAYTGQFVFNVLMPVKDPAAIDHYNKLCRRMLAPMESALGASPYLAGDAYSIADIIAYPVATVSMRRYPGSLDGYPNIARWVAALGARPAVQAGMRVPRAP